jgi:hypothetical protein
LRNLKDWSKPNIQPFAKLLARVVLSLPLARLAPSVLVADLTNDNLHQSQQHPKAIVSGSATRSSAKNMRIIEQKMPERTCQLSKI